VLMFNGDSHVYRSENPLMPQSVTNPCAVQSGNTDAPCADDDFANQSASLQAFLSDPDMDLTKFHRVVVHGSTFPLEWLKLDVNPRANVAPGGTNAIGPFRWTRPNPAQP